jgi:hypothetical protein
MKAKRKVFSIKNIANKIGAPIKIFLDNERKDSKNTPTSVKRYFPVDVKSSLPRNNKKIKEHKNICPYEPGCPVKEVILDWFSIASRKFGFT